MLIKLCLLKKSFFYRSKFYILKKYDLIFIKDKNQRFLLKKKIHTFYISIFIPRLMIFQDQFLTVYTENLENNRNVKYGKE